MKNYYELLDIPEDATPEQIKRAWRVAASVLHPDKNPGKEAEAAEKFRKMKEAYECLSDPERRKIYDETGDAMVKSGDPVEDLFVHLLNEITDHFDTVTEVIDKCRLVIEQLIDECSEQKIQKDRRMVVIKSMIQALRFKGNGTNLIEGILTARLQRLEEDRQQLDDVSNAAKGVWELLKEYEATDRPMPDSPFETAESLRIETIEGMMKNVFGGRANHSGKRHGGMPFSGV